MSRSKQINPVIALLGLWQIAAPFALGYAHVTAPLWNSVIVGALLIGFSLTCAVTTSAVLARTMDWLNVILGIWLIVAPFVMGYAGIVAGLWNAVIVGTLVAALSLWALTSLYRRVRTPPA